jgi:hypothetical protein
MTWSEAFPLEKALHALEIGGPGGTDLADGAAEDDVYAQELRALLRELAHRPAFLRSF